MPLYYMESKRHVAVFMVETDNGCRLLSRVFTPSKHETNLAFRERVEDAIAQEFKGINVMRELFIIPCGPTEIILSGTIPQPSK